MKIRLARSVRPRMSERERVEIERERERENEGERERGINTATVPLCSDQSRWTPRHGRRHGISGPIDR